MDTASFKNYINEKYGSYESAVSKTSYYRVAYEHDDRMLDQSAYSALTSSLKKYWRPVVNDSGSTLFYTRKEMELVSETNKVISISIANTSSYAVGENVYQSNATGGNIAAGNIKAIPDTTTLIIQHITGAFASSNASIANVYGVESKSTQSISNTNVLYTAIPADEFVYWEPVNYFTYEDNLNMSRKYINLIDSTYLDKIEKEIHELL